MRKALFVLALGAMTFVALSGAWAAETKEAGKASDNATKKPAFPNKIDQLSYAIGMNIGQNLATGIKSGEIEVNLPILYQAMKDVIEGKKTAMTEDEVRQTFMNLRQEMMAKQKEKAEKNKKEGEKFLAENVKKEGIKTTKSGLQYKVLKEGTGPMPKSTDRVKVNYKGMLLDGKEFDSSYKRGQPAVFPVTGVIPGWSEALQIMKVGSKWELFIPSKLGYGENGWGPNIPGNSVLHFEVELLGIEPPSTQPAMPQGGMPGMMPGGKMPPRPVQPKK